MKLSKTLFKLAKEIDAQKQQSNNTLFSYSGHSPDGDYRYYDAIVGYVNNGNIQIEHTDGSAAGGMDTFGGGVSDKKIIKEFKQPISIKELVDWIKMSLRSHDMPFLKFVKLKDITWYDGTKRAKGLSTQIIAKAMQSANLQTKEKIKVKEEQKKINPLLDKANKIWNGMSQEEKDIALFNELGGFDSSVRKKLQTLNLDQFYDEIGDEYTNDFIKAIEHDWSE